jgi:hypothetical protein
LLLFALGRKRGVIRRGLVTRMEFFGVGGFIGTTNVEKLMICTCGSRRVSLSYCGALSLVCSSSIVSFRTRIHCAPV